MFVRPDEYQVLITELKKKIIITIISNNNNNTIQRQRFTMVAMSLMLRYRYECERGKEEKK